jgi:hypothetical protein
MKQELVFEFLIFLQTKPTHYETYCITDAIAAIGSGSKTKSRLGVF